MTNDIELVIKMPEDVFKRTIIHGEFRDLNDCITTIKALENAISLPEGHGRIGDLDKILIWMIHKHIIDDLKCGAVTPVFKDATILESPQSESEGM